MTFFKISISDSFSYYYDVGTVGSKKSDTKWFGLVWFIPMKLIKCVLCGLLWTGTLWLTTMWAVVSVFSFAIVQYNISPTIIYIFGA